MILFFSLSKVLLGVLSLSLAILVFIIAYRKLLLYMGRTNLVQADYANLYTIEIQPSKGEIEFFYELKQLKECTLSLLNVKLEKILEVDKRMGKIGGQKIKFDTSTVENGTYFYQLETDNQKISKKIFINN
ncbi:MAG: hypothetical protein ACI9XP_001605 [Lentimonas sp.]|jgi:hypothetical protein